MQLKSVSEYIDGTDLTPILRFGGDLFACLKSYCYIKTTLEHMELLIGTISV